MGVWFTHSITIITKLAPLCSIQGTIWVIVWPIFTNEASSRNDSKDVTKLPMSLLRLTKAEGKLSRPSSLDCGSTIFLLCYNVYISAIVVHDNDN